MSAELSPRLIELARVPRSVCRELESMGAVGAHPFVAVAAWATVGGTMLLIGAGVFGGFRLVPWVAVGLGPVLAGTGLLLGKRMQSAAQERGRELLSRMPLSLVTVVQANQVLFHAEEVTSAPVVVTYALGPAALDPDFMLEVASRVASLRGAHTGDPELDHIGELLDDEESEFQVQLPGSLTGDTRVWAATTVIDPNTIPGGYLREESVLAGLLDEQGELYGLLPARLYD